MTRAEQLEIIWSTTHRDFRGVHPVRSILVDCGGAGTIFVPLDKLTDKQVADRMPKVVRA